MYHILIVDDERIERNGIKFLLKRLDVEMHIAEAANGKIALEYMDKNPVDILLTDVKMPFVDGIELIRTIASKKPKMKIIIFSGYSEFEYARFGIQMGVENYILKPVDPKEFEITMCGVIKELDHERMNRKLQDKNQNFMKEYLLYSLVNGMPLEQLKETTAGLVDMNFLQEYCTMILVEFNHDFFGKVHVDFQQTLQEELKEPFTYLNLNPQQCLILRKRAEGGLRNRQFGEKLLDMIEHVYHLQPYLAISQEVTEFWNMAQYFDELEELMENKFYQTDVHIYMKESENDRKENSDALVQTSDNMAMTQIKQDIKMKDVDALKKHIHNLCDKYKKAQDFSQIYTKFIFCNLLKELYECMPKKSEKELNRDIEQLYATSHFDELMEIIDKNIQAVGEWLGEDQSSLHKEVSTVKQYIYDHYKEEISVDLLADKVYMAPSYLSHIFKKETGQNLSKFIKTYRMEKAREKLETTHEKIVNISYEVGYQNVSYFCQSFREYFGVSPQKFRGN